jgi:hypothetical protein
MQLAPDSFLSSRVRDNVKDGGRPSPSEWKVEVSHPSQIGVIGFFFVSMFGLKICVSRHKPLFKIVLITPVAHSHELNYGSLISFPFRVLFSVSIRNVEPNGVVARR